MYSLQKTKTQVVRTRTQEQRTSSPAGSFVRALCDKHYIQEKMLTHLPQMWKWKIKSQKYLRACADKVEHKRFWHICLLSDLYLAAAPLCKHAHGKFIEHFVVCGGERTLWVFWGGMNCFSPPLYDVLNHCKCVEIASENIHVLFFHFTKPRS